jgi:hypothetical protein
VIGYLPCKEVALKKGTAHLAWQKEIRSLDRGGLGMLDVGELARQAKRGINIDDCFDDGEIRSCATRIGGLDGRKECARRILGTQNNRNTPEPRIASKMIRAVCCFVTDLARTRGTIAQGWMWWAPTQAYRAFGFGKREKIGQRDATLRPIQTSRPIPRG